MCKIHPAERQNCLASTKPITTTTTDERRQPAVLTVWKRSSMSFQGTDGFTVFDDRGSLVFRVDNYTRKSWSVGGGGLLLMDGSGKALLTLKPQYLLRMQHQWIAYKGDEDEAACQSSKVFTMRRPPSSLISSRRSRQCPCEAQVFLGGGGESLMTMRKQPADFISEGYFRRRNCKISVAETGQVVASVSRKRINTTLLLNDDVFTLTVQPGFDPAQVMAFIVILDRICFKNFTPVICSYYLSIS